MTRHILTDEDIKKVLHSAITGSVKELFNKKKVKLTVPNSVKVSNGYIVAMTINDSGGIKIKHVSVSNPGGLTDPAESDAIATDILGKGYQIIPGVTNPNVIHYIKPESSTVTKDNTKNGGIISNKMREVSENVKKDYK